MSCRIRIESGQTLIRHPFFYRFPAFTGRRLDSAPVFTGVTRRHDDFDNILLPEGERNGLPEGFRNQYNFVPSLGQ
jgi:hypothetical protein